MYTSLNCHILYIIFVPLIEICLYLPDTNRVTPKMLVGVSLAFLGTYLLCGCGWHCAGALHWGDLNISISIR
mgnify:CR=1 FL=1